MGWHYGIIKLPAAKEAYYGVCEVYEIDGETCYSPDVKPFGESVEELILDLERMLSDLRKHSKIHGGVDE